MPRPWKWNKFCLTARSTFISSQCPSSWRKAVTCPPSRILSSHENERPTPSWEAANQTHNRVNGKPEWKLPRQNSLELSIQREATVLFQKLNLEKLIKYLSSDPHMEQPEAETGPHVVLTQDLLEAFLSTIIFILSYPKLSGLEQRSISLFLPLLLIQNWDGEQQDCLHSLW